MKTKSITKSLDLKVPIGCHREKREGGNALGCCSVDITKEIVLIFTHMPNFCMFYALVSHTMTLLCLEGLQTSGYNVSLPER